MRFFAIGALLSFLVASVSLANDDCIRENCVQNSSAPRVDTLNQFQKPGNTAVGFLTSTPASNITSNITLSASIPSSITTVESLDFVAENFVCDVAPSDEVGALATLEDVATSVCSGPYCTLMPFIAKATSSQAPGPTGTTIGGSTTTPTNTPTNEGTGAPTNTPTNEGTGVPTNTPTNEGTGVPTNTPTNEGTGVPTSIATARPTASNTATATNTATRTPVSGNIFNQIKWSQVASMSYFRSEAQGAVVDGRLYVFGGYSVNTRGTYAPTDTMTLYNPVADTWTLLPSRMPIGISHAGVAAEGRDIYVAGGYPWNGATAQRFATSDVWKFNVDSLRWTRMPSLPSARGAGALAIVGHTLHFFFGIDQARNDVATHWTLDLDQVAQGVGWVDANSVNPLPLELATNHVGAAVLNNKIYIVGGQKDSRKDGNTSAHLFVYDPATRVWTRLSDMPGSRSHINDSVFVLGNRIVVAGGDERGIPVATLFAYDTALDTWGEMTPLGLGASGFTEPVTRKAGVGVVIDGKIFFAGGRGSPSSADRYVFKGELVPQ